MLTRLGIVLGLFLFSSYSTRTLGSAWNSLSLKIGSMRYQTEGVDPSQGQEAGFLSFEYAHFWKSNLATLAALRTVDKSDVKRNLYQASLLGIRYYPFGLGVPISTKLENNVLEFDSWFKPYLDLGTTLGRYLIRVAGNPAVLEASSPFIGLVVTAGIQIKVVNQYAVDFSLNLEKDFGYGSPLAMKATNSIALFGITGYL